MTEGNKSEINLKINESSINIAENFSEFYKLHYPQRKNAEDHKNAISFRAKSVNNVTQSKNPEELAEQLHSKHKKTLKERIKQHSKQKDIIKTEKQSQKFSFKQVLSKQFKPENIQGYFTKFPSKTHVDLDEYSRKNIGVKLAIQKCKDQKIKIQKVISSSKQSDQTKLDYLQLKKKDIEQEIRNEIRAIYDQYFKKEYQGDKNGFAEFQAKMRTTIEILQQQMFNTK